MTIQEAVKCAAQELRKTKNSSPDLDAEVLLAYALGKERVFLLTHPNKKLSPTQVKKYKSLIARRKKHEPVAYITGIKHFFRLPFKITKDVLIPRPESEILVNYSYDYLINNDGKFTVIDLGTGSGAITVALAKEYPRANYIGTDISEKVLRIAKLNAAKNGAKIDFYKSDLFKRFIDNRKFFKKNPHILLVANLPYLPTRIWKQAPPDVKKYEPRIALDGGPNGLKYYTKLIDELKSIVPMVKSFVAFWEIDPTQVNKLDKLLKSKLKAKQIKAHKDLCGRIRVISWQK